MFDEQPDALSLAAAFPAADRDAWRALVDKALMGAPYEKALTTALAEGIRTEPIYAAADAPSPADAATRHADAVERVSDGWDIRSLHTHPDPAVTNAAILADLERGARSVLIRLDKAGRRGGTALTDPDNTGVDGVTIDGATSLDAVLDGVFLDAAAVAFQPGGAFGGLADLLVDLWRRRGLVNDAVLGHLGADPLGALVSEGALPEPLDRSLARMADLAVRLHRDYPRITTISVDTAPYHAAGANEAMDLGYALATGVAYLRALEAGGLAPAEAARRRMVFSLPVGVDVFLGIAKLRAARRLWAQVLDASGVPQHARGMTLHVTTAEAAWSERDPWVNMLRATVATFAGAVGGADALTVLPYTDALGLPDGFARRIARNTQVILAEESNLARVIDPAGGSWYVESLTEQLAQRAWSHFQDIEAVGGMAAALTGGVVARQCAEAWSERERGIARRRQELTGVNTFPNVDEAPVDVASVDRAALVETARERLANEPNPLKRASGEGTAITPLAAHRLGEAFAVLRNDSDAHRDRTGSRPTALLVLLGGPAQHTARATFARNYLGAGGIAAIDCMADGQTDMSGAISEAKTDLAVLCGSDTLYAEQAADVARALKQAGAREVILAGRAGDHEAVWAEAGIDGYMFAGDDTLATLRRLLQGLHVISDEGDGR